MQLTIVLDGFEDAAQLDKIYSAVSAYCGKNEESVVLPANPLIKGLSELIAKESLKVFADRSPKVEKLGETDYRIPGTPENKQLHADMAEIGKEFARVDAEHAAAGYDAIDTNTGEVIHVPPASQIFATEAEQPPLAPTPPVAPAPAAAPTSTSAPPVASGTSVELDVAGLPWDERIHSSNHKKNGKGEWWAKRNVSPETLAGVQIELRKLLANGWTGPTVDDPIDPATLLTQGELTAAGAPPIPPVPPVAPTVDVQTRFNALVAGIMAKKLDFTQIGAGLAAIGVVPSNLPTLKTAAEKDPTILDRAAAQFGIVLP